MLNINLQKLLNGDIRRAVHTTRYSTFPVLRVESVAEHTYNTVSYAAIIAYHLEYQRVDVDMRVVLTRALWHDIEEPAGIGDLLRRVKHSSPEFLAMIEAMGLKEVQRVQSELNLRRGELSNAWEDAKDDSIEGQIVRVADALSVAAYLIEEYRLGNRTHQKLHEEFTEYLYAVQNKVQNQHLQHMVEQSITYFCEAVEHIHMRVL